MHRQVIWKQPWSKQRHWKHKVSNFKIKQEAEQSRDEGDIKGGTGAT